MSLETDIQRNATGADGVVIPIQFGRNADGRLEAISFLPQVSSADRAIAATYPLVMSTVSFWSAILGIPLCVYGMVVLDEKHAAQFEARPQHAAAEPFWLPKGIEIGEKWHIILGLYREGKASSSPYFQFLMFFKVLEGFYERKSELIGPLKQVLKARGLEYREPSSEITKEILVLAMVPSDWVAEWEGRSFGALYKQLDHSYRLRIAHTFPKDQPALNPDDWDDYHRTVALANLLDQVARNLITSHLEQMIVKTATGELPRK